MAAGPSVAGVRFLGDVGGCVRSADLPVPVGVTESADADSEDERALRLVARTAADFRPPALTRSDGGGVVHSCLTTEATTAGQHVQGGGGMGQLQRARSSSGEQLQRGRNCSGL